MKAIKIIFSLALWVLMMPGCKKDTYTDTAFVDAGKAPEALTALFEITQDNTGFVTITPNGTNAVSYDVYYGDAVTTPAKVLAGKNTTHTYAEGVYNVKLVAWSVSGKSAEVTKQLTVSFRAPENLK
ncbi:MAG: PKD domain-containing protein [Chitinophagaceae bacterium]|nr:PKD domain-containing protein [Chitinophagaceae bacterium]